MSAREQEECEAFKNEELKQWFNNRPKDIPENASEFDRSVHDYQLHDWARNAPKVSDGYENDRR